MIWLHKSDRLFVWFFFFFKGRASQCSPGWPQTPMFFLPQFSKCWDYYRHAPPYLAWFQNVRVFFFFFGLGIEFRTLHLPGKRWATSPAPEFEFSTSTLLFSNILQIIFSFLNLYYYNHISVFNFTHAIFPVMIITNNWMNKIRSFSTYEIKKWIAVCQQL